MSAYADENKLTRFTLPNGLDALIKKDPARHVVTIQLWVMVGAADETNQERGISHLIEHMAFKGTQRRGVGQIASEVEALGGSTNAYTSWDRTVFHVTVPSDKVLQGLDILTDAVLLPAIDPDELEKEKKVVLEEILEGEERPERKSFKLLFQTAYTTSPYQYPVIGFKDTVASFNRDHIFAFRSKWYVPQNMFLLVVGDVDSVKLRPEIERMTAGLKSVAFVRLQRPEEPVQHTTRSSCVRDTNARETRLHIAFHIPSAKSAEVNGLDLTADVLGARESSRLIRVIKKEKHLVNSISAYAVTPKEPGMFIVSATLDSKNLEATTKAVMEELKKLGTEPLSEEELQRAKTHIESSHVYDKQTVGGIAQRLGSFEADLGDAALEENYLKANAAVTAEEISDVARRFLTPPNATVTVLIPEGHSPDFRVEQLAKVIDSYGSGGPQRAEAALSDKAVTRTLQNGVRVILLPDPSNPVVSFKIASLGGKRFETRETEGIMNFVAQMLNKGAGSMTEIDIARKVENLGGRLGVFSGYDSFGLDATFFSRNFEEGLKLLSEIYSDPSFPQDKLERERKLIINNIKTAPDRPIEFAIKTLNETLYTRHPYGFDKEGTIDTVSQFSRDDLIRAYRRVAVPSNTVITGVGGMDVDKTMAEISRLFGNIPAMALDVAGIPLEDPLDTIREKTVRIPRAKAHLVIGFRGTTLKDDDRYALEVLNNVLAGQGGRLFSELRDKESLAYTVTSFVRPGTDPGMVAFYMACDPSKVDQAVTGLFREIKRIRESKVTEDELARSKNNLIGRRRIALQSPWARAEDAALNDLYGLGYDFDPEYTKRISSVTADQVLAVARKYLDEHRYAFARILPEKASAASCEGQGVTEGRGDGS